MITVEEALEIHAILLDSFGGKSGTRDRGLLEAALQRPYQTFDNKELYPSAIDKSAAILESIVKNHPFVDGNKRVGYVLARLILMANGKDIVADQETKYQFVMGVADGSQDFQQIKDWIEKHSS